jgi:molybdate transport system ATP-binding protein
MLSVYIQKKFRSDNRITFALDCSFDIPQGISVLFGPSGSGKTTILRSIAGIVEPDAGRIDLAGRVYFDSDTKVNVPIQSRNIGFVFQDYLLFPHLSAIQNVSYAIRSRTPNARRERAFQLLKSLGIDYAAERRPRQLSGGEQQRVTLARALASDPDILLLDEPMSALDGETRVRLLGELVELQRKWQIPFLYVTHSPADAVRVGDFIILLRAGRVVEVGKPAEVFNAPRDMEVSRAVGDENILVGRIKDQNELEGVTVVDLVGCQLVIPYHPMPIAAPVTIGLRADDIIISRERVERTSARNLLEGTIQHVVQDGQQVIILTDCGTTLKTRITAQAFQTLGLQPGIKVYLLIKASSCVVLP